MAGSRVLSLGMLIVSVMVGLEVLKIYPIVYFHSSTAAVELTILLTITLF